MGVFFQGLAPPWFGSPFGLVLWSRGPLVLWSPGPLVPGPGPVVLWSPGPLVSRSMFSQNLAKLSKKRHVTCIMLSDVLQLGGAAPPPTPSSFFGAASEPANLCKT